MVPQFTVPDLVRTAEYYRDVLGFKIDGYWDGQHASLAPANPPVFAIVSRDGVQLFFNRPTRGKAPVIVPTVPMMPTCASPTSTL